VPFIFIKNIKSINKSHSLKLSLFSLFNNNSFLFLIFPNVSPVLGMRACLAVLRQNINVYLGARRRGCPIDLLRGEDRRLGRMGCHAADDCCRCYYFPSVPARLFG